MATIQQAGDVLTVIVVFTIPPDQQSAFVRQLENVAAKHSEHDGFVSCAIRHSEDGVRVVEYIQWRSGCTSRRCWLRRPLAVTSTSRRR